MKLKNCSLEPWGHFNFDPDAFPLRGGTSLKGYRLLSPPSLELTAWKWELVLQLANKHVHKVLSIQDHMM